ncbi:MAG: mandelate racemase/muconate lactonizing enzyme family protein [Dehalococcoidia bacterium]
MSDAGRPVRLVGLRWRPFRLPLRHRFEAAHGALADRAGVLIEVRAADGVAGIGEASPMPSLGDGAVADVLALLEDRAAAMMRSPDEALAALTGSMAAPGAAALACALDTAMLDLEGQRGGVPAARLLCERPLQATHVNAVVGSGGVDETLAFAAEAVVAGYSVLKMKVAAGDLGADVARVAAVRQAYPEVRVRLDANGAWTERQAAQALEALGALDVELVEQPVRASAVRALQRLHRRGLAPLAADEAVSDPEALKPLIEQRAVDFLVLKPMRIGGPRRSLDIARRAAERGIPSFVTTTFDSSIGTATALQLAAALGAGRPADGLSTGDHLADDLVTRPLRPRRGRLRVPVRSGIGVELRPAAVDRLATGPWAEVRGRRR